MAPKRKDLKDGNMGSPKKKSTKEMKASSSSASVEDSPAEKSPNQDSKPTATTSFDSFFNETPSEEFTLQPIISSPSMFFDTDSNKHNLSYRKISLEVASSLPIENDSSESEDGVQAEKPVLESSVHSDSSLIEVKENELSSAVKAMSLDQIEEHISCCLQLNTENKINTKNAFALKLIDCMTVIMKNKSDEDNFTAVACQLDAGTKIYSNRVDAVHQQVMKLADSCIFAEKGGTKKNDKDSEDEDIGGEEKDEKTRRKKAKKKILAAPDQITRKLKEKNPRDNYVKLDARPGGVLQKARRDPDDLSLTLNKNVPFWRMGRDSRVGGTSILPKTDLKIRQMALDLEIESLLQFVPPQPEKPNTYTSFDYDNPQPSTSADYEEPPPSPECDYDEPIEVNQVEEAEGVTNTAESKEVKIVSVAESRMAKEMSSKPSRLDVIRALFYTEGEHDYDYLKMESKQYWAGPSYWKRPQGASAVALKRKASRKKKEPAEINYKIDEQEKSLKSFGVAPSKRNTKLKGRTLANWTMKKVTFPLDVQFEPQNLYRLFNIDIDVLLSDKNAEDEEDSGNEEDIDVRDDSSQGEEIEIELLQDNYDPSQDLLPLGDVLENQFISPDFATDTNLENEENPEEAPLEQEMEAVGSLNPSDNEDDNDDVYEGNNLVPMVKMVQVEPIRCITKPKSVDLHHLKEVMLQVILEHIEDKENQTTENVSKTVAFKDVYYELINSTRLEDKTREDLNVHMAYFALLCLTCEHNLSMNQPELSPHADVMIGFALGENSLSSTPMQSENNFFTNLSN